MKIPLTMSWLGTAEERAVREVLRSGWLVQGARVAEFERLVAAYTGAPHTVAVTSCTTALHLALLLEGVGPGDEVICPSYSFVATANAILYTGATPILADIDRSTFNLDPGSVEAALSPATTAIMPVHQFGLPAEMRAFREIAAPRRIAVVEDAACALGSRYRGRMIGSLGNIACFSFHPRKIVTTGEGGMLALPTERLARRARSLRTHGASVYAFDRHTSKKPVFETYDEAGYNYRMTDLQAAVGVAQMARLGRIIAARRRLAARYSKALAGLEGVETPYVPPDVECTFQTYAIMLKAPLDRHRDRILGLLAEKGVSARRGIPPIHRQSYWVKRFGRMSLPVTEAVSRASLFLPLYPTLRREEQDYVLGTLAGILKKLR